MDDDNLDTLSDTSSTIFHEEQSDPDVLARLDNETTIDLTVDQIDQQVREGSEALASSIADHDDGGAPIEKVVFKSRAYQLEMLEESLKRNIIVAMDTGSGKTHVASLRISHELDVIQSHQLVWFLAPKVALASQQHDYFCSQITSVQIKYLSGADGCERWTNKRLWDALLENVKIVVSTPQILLDALSHACVNLDRIALLIFDEAHNCTGKSPEAKIMRNFYHNDKASGKKLPAILGLTASPVMKSNPDSLYEIESRLDSICRTPTRHRLELQSQVKLPTFLKVLYDATVSYPEIYTCSMTALQQALINLKIMEDPYVLSLKADGSEKSKRQLAKVLLNHKTWTQEQMKRFLRTSLTLHVELGSWGVDYYIARVITNTTSLMDKSGMDGFTGLLDISSSEKQYLATVLHNITVMDLRSPAIVTAQTISNKVSRLVDVLLEQDDDVRGIVFVNQRATAEVLAVLLGSLASTGDRFRFGTFVGISMSARRTKEIADVVNLKAQKHVLERFRTGEINIVIATDVLEEGIDVPACNLVVCFDSPKNLKSFVQRRGRARQKESKLIMFFDQQKDQGKVSQYQELEEKMKRIYEDESRELRAMLEDENDEEDAERFYRIDKTGAVLDLDNAISHLYHFCATLPAKQYVDMRPEFIFDVENKLVKARVILPLSVDESVRTANSLTSWKSEKNAKKDVSFQAYVALHKAGLVGDNLLPHRMHDGEAGGLLPSTVEERSSMMEVAEVLNPWVAVSRAWCQQGVTVHKYALSVGDLVVDILLPIELPIIDPFDLHWDATTALNVTIDYLGPVNHEDTATAVTTTHTILNSAFGHRFHVEAQQQPLLLSVRDSVIATEFSRNTSANCNTVQVGLIWDTKNANVPYMFKAYLEIQPPVEFVQQPYSDYADVDVHGPHISVKKLPKRHNFLQRVLSSPSSAKKLHSAVVPVSRASFGDIQFGYVRFALMFPSILHHFSIYMLAQRLAETVLKDVHISNIELIRTAICASSAQESTNYQRVEFLGDAILKLCISIQLFDDYPVWHEGLLSSKKDRIVSNARLTKAAMDAGLDMFINTKQFTGLKWRPSFVKDLVSMPESAATRSMSSKTLADIVESLVGAATIDGGLEKSIKCLSIFLTEVNWQSLATRQSLVYARALDGALPPVLKPLETLLGYKFSKGSLLVESITHASYLSSTTGSLERLEFLGDAILDHIIVTEMWGYNLSHQQMHLLRTAMVNADYLAFICLESSIDQPTTDIDIVTLAPETTTERWALWRFLRHSSTSLAREQQITAAQHLLLRDEINQAIESGTHYPWALLSKLGAGKYFSDMIESILGAVWIDSYSKQSPQWPTPSDNNRKTEYSKLPEEPIFAACKAVMERLGVLHYMRRVVRDNVHILHPKEDLGILADCETVKYVIDARNQTDEEGLEYLCTVSVGGVDITSVDGGVSKGEVKTKAAQRAVKILKERKARMDCQEGGIAAEDSGVDLDSEEVHVRVGVIDAMEVDG